MSGIKNTELHLVSDSHPDTLKTSAFLYNQGKVHELAMQLTNFYNLINQPMIHGNAIYHLLIK